MLTSVDGEYRLKLLGNCSLEMHKFNWETTNFELYKIINSPLLVGQNDCRSLNLSLPQKGLITDKNTVFMRLNPNQEYDTMAFKLVRRN